MPAADGAPCAPSELTFERPARHLDLRVVAVMALVLFHLFTPLTTVTRPGFGDARAVGTDPGRYQEIAVATGTPGRDFRVEYPPLAVLGMRVIGRSGLHTLMARLAWLNGLADLAIGLALWWAWSRRAALAYLVIVLPLLAMLMAEFDLIATAIAVVGLACTRKGRHVVGGVLIAAAAFVKIWPVLLVGVLLLWRHRRAVVAAITTLVGGGLAWIAWSGPRGPIDVLTYRGARGWQVESTVGALVGLLGGAKAHVEQGAYRVGHPAPILGVILAGATGIGLGYWYWRTRRRDAGAVAQNAGTWLLGALAIVLVGASLLSPQYLVWGIPFAAIAVDERHVNVAVAYGAAVLLDLVYILTSGVTHPDRATAHMEVLARNGMLLVVLVLAFRELYCVSQARRTSASTSTYALPLTSTVTECNVPVKGYGAA